MNFNNAIMRVSFHTSSPSLAKNAIPQTARLITDSGAASGSANVRKKLFPGSTALKKINSYCTEVRAFHDSQTAEWASPVRILRISNYPEYEYRMNEMVDAFDPLVALFVADYEAQVEQARLSLQGLFNPADYPTAAAMARKFSMTWQLREDRTAGVSHDDWRLALGEEVAERAARKAVESRQNEINTMMLGHYKRIAGGLEIDGKAGKQRMDDYLEGFSTGNRLHQAKFDALVADCQFIREMNLGGDPEINRLADGLESALTEFNLETIKHDPAARGTVVTNVRQTLEEVDFTSKMDSLL